MNKDEEEEAGAAPPTSDVKILGDIASALDGLEVTGVDEQSGTITMAPRPPLVSILDDAAEDATAARIRDLEERNAALEVKLKEATTLLGLSAPWEELAKDRGGELDALDERLQTVANEAFGPFPIQSPDENLTAIERGIAAERRRNLEQRTGLLATITKLEKAKARAKAAPPPRAKTKKKGGRS